MNDFKQSQINEIQRLKKILLLQEKELRSLLNEKHLYEQQRMGYRGCLKRILKAMTFESMANRSTDEYLTFLKDEISAINDEMTYYRFVIPRLVGYSPLLDYSYRPYSFKDICAG